MKPSFLKDNQRWIEYIYTVYDRMIWNHWTVLVIHSTIYIFLLLDSRCGFDLRKSQQMTHFSLNYDQPDCFVMFCSSPTRHVASKSSEVCSKSAHISSKLCSRIAYLRWIIIDWLHGVQLRKSCKNPPLFHTVDVCRTKLHNCIPKEMSCLTFFFFFCFHQKLIYLRSKIQCMMKYLLLHCGLNSIFISVIWLGGSHSSVQCSFNRLLCIFWFGRVHIGLCVKAAETLAQFVWTPSSDCGVWRHFHIRQCAAES